MSLVLHAVCGTWAALRLWLRWLKFRAIAWLLSTAAHKWGTLSFVGVSARKPFSTDTLGRQSA
jgi:hypothetical protein